MTARPIASDLPPGKKAIYSTGPDVAKKSKASQYRHKATEKASDRKQSLLSAAYFPSRSSSISTTTASQPPSSAVSQYTLSDRASSPDIIDLGMLSDPSGENSSGSGREGAVEPPDTEAAAEYPERGQRQAAKIAVVALENLYKFSQEPTEEGGENTEGDEGTDDEVRYLIAGSIRTDKTGDTDPVKPWPQIRTQLDAVLKKDKKKRQLSSNQVCSGRITDWGTHHWIL